MNKLDQLIMLARRMAGQGLGKKAVSQVLLPPLRFQSDVQDFSNNPKLKKLRTRLTKVVKTFTVKKESKSETAVISEKILPEPYKLSIDKLKHSSSITTLASERVICERLSLKIESYVKGIKEQNPTRYDFERESQKLSKLMQNSSQSRVELMKIKCQLLNVVAQQKRKLSRVHI